MSTWQALTDTDAYRWVTKRGPTRTVFRSGAYRHLDTERLRLLARRGVQRAGDRYDHVRTMAVFVGHNKSGSSMLGGLLDAHPDIVLSDESDALRYVQAGFERQQLWWLLDRRSRNEARNGRVTARRLEPYSYAVPGQHQGRSERPLVVGDSTTGTATRRLSTQAGLLHRTIDTAAPARVRFVQVVRNPFDPIAVMVVRGKRTLAEAIERYFEGCRQLEDLRARIEPDDLHVVRHETFVTDPCRGLADVCEFLGVDADRTYLSACASIVRPVPDRSRTWVEWTPADVAEVERRIGDHDFLKGYRYED